MSLLGNISLSTPSGYRNGKFYYEITIPGIPTPAIIFWSSDNNRWEMRDSTEAALYGYNQNPGYYPISDEQYVWISTSETISPNITTPNSCVSVTICVSFSDPTQNSSLSVINKVWKQSTLVSRGYNDGKLWFIGEVVITGAKYYYYIIWDNAAAEWQAWDTFDPITGPSGTQYASLPNDTEYPIGDNWVSINDLSGYEIFTSSAECPSLICFIFTGNNITSAFQTSICSGIFNGKCYFLIPSPDGDDPVYVMWNNITHRWECYDDFTPEVGPYGTNTIFRGYLDNPGSLPLSTANYQWVVTNNDMNVLYSSLGECQPITNTTTITSCDSYTWSQTGQTYTQSGTYTKITNTGDIDVLILTIIPSINEVTQSSACDSYKWSANNVTYTTSGTYTVNTGCNTKTLILAITASTTNTTTINQSTSYTWPVTGLTYQNSGTYTIVNGCATEILDFTLTPITTDCTKYTTLPDAIIPLQGNLLYYSDGTVVTGYTGYKGIRSAENFQKWIVRINENGVILETYSPKIPSFCSNSPGTIPRDEIGAYIGTCNNVYDTLGGVCNDPIMSGLI